MSVFIISFVWFHIYKSPNAALCGAVFDGSTKICATVFTSEKMFIFLTITYIL